MRELTGGLYFGERKTEEVDGVLTATDTLTYNENEIRRIAITELGMTYAGQGQIVEIPDDGSDYVRQYADIKK